MYGKLRSSEAALNFINKRGSDKGVHVLQGGFREFLVENVKSGETNVPSDLIENYNPSLWTKDQYHQFDVQQLTPKQK